MIGAPLLRPDSALIEPGLILHQRGLLTRGPKEARDSIKSYFQCDLASSGDDCWGIVRLRELIHDVDPHLACALVIISSHTHWDDKDFIVEQIDSSRAVYRIGPSRALPDPVMYPLVPISFVLAPEGPIAFEWADNSTGLAAAVDLGRLWSGIEDIHRRLAAETSLDSWPLGLSVHHRFKDLWSPPEVGTLESPAKNPLYAEVRQSVAAPKGTDEVVQVAWSSFIPEELTPEEECALTRLDAALTDMGEERGLRALAELRRLGLSSHPATVT